MKAQRISVPQFTGYPLRIIEDNVVYFPKTLHVATVHELSEEKKQITAADPQNWDEGWFSNYE